MSKQYYISTEAARGNLIPTDVSNIQNRPNQKQIVVFAYTLFINLFLAKEIF